ncbi:ankyrin repeat domain-containing protein [Oecophyllibacter saccharovorans]|uniref:Ankyrin repeat domain-containing protein n=1 Tax=Oecophyllibacter saccharovorans TaxID=2558360 RepID=A0A506UL01_9PROT|nr:ankyrin repeat domain-containing protein [Oecophyllibacter saccharovorans]TPW33843.1 ankyrin repeat domain-containing protein [Oecophyllibacter saccharovorans]TPW35186.1 ankyrin repeat domain-containing protein [Oecophyllibacter saccharovorans]
MMKKDPVASFLGVLPLWGTLGLAVMCIGHIQMRSDRLIAQAQADQPPLMKSQNGLQAPLSEAETQRKLHEMFDTSTETQGPLPKAPGLARLGVSEAHLKAVWFDAAREGKTDILAGLVKRGFNPDLQDSKGYTALILATYHDHAPTVQALLALGAKPCAADRKGNTALMGAAFKGEAGLVRLLAEHGCPVNTQNDAGQTALMMASLFGRTEAVKTLLALGADPALVDKSGATALSLAQTQGESAMSSLLQEALKASPPTTH